MIQLLAEAGMELKCSRRVRRTLACKTVLDKDEYGNWT